MPTSFHTQLNEIMDLIILTDPHSLLDVGVGHGKYGFLSREYLELWDGREDGYRVRKRLIDGIELMESFITPVHEYAYDNIYIGSALNIVPNLDRTYDLVLLIDVVEHLGRAEGLDLLRLLANRATNTIVSTPLDAGVGNREEAVFGGPCHKFQWTRKDFGCFENVFFFPNKNSLICYIGKDAVRVKKEIRSAKNKMLKAKAKTWLPLIVAPAKMVKKLFRCLTISTPT